MMHKTFNTLLLMLLLMVFLPVVSEAKIYLVTVGISNYPGRENDLTNPYNDAATMQWLYKDNQHASVKFLGNEHATVANIKKAMVSLFSKASVNDIVILFFSGHGVKGSFACYDDFLSYSAIRKIMSSINCKNKMIFADACFAGAIRNSGNRSSSDYGALGSNIMLFLSCRSNEQSIEEQGMTNGYFTYALQHGLRGGADYNKDRVITARELFKYVSAKVKKMSNNMQHPVMWGKFSDNMPVMMW